MPELKGGCTCRSLLYTLSLPTLDAARTTLCHCSSCKVALGGAFGLTAKLPLSAFELTAGEPKIFQQSNGVRRAFCKECGAFIWEVGEANFGEWRYVMVGTLDDGPDALPPKGEFFTSERCQWMPRIPNTFQKKKIKE